MSDERICTICSKTLNDGDHNYHGGSNEGDHDFTTDPVETSATKIDKEFEGMATDEVYQREAIELLGEDAANTKSAGGLLGSSVATSSPEAAPLSGEGGEPQGTYSCPLCKENCPHTHLGLSNLQERARHEWARYQEIAISRSDEAITSFAVNFTAQIIQDSALLTQDKIKSRHMFQEDAWIEKKAIEEDGANICIGTIAKLASVAAQGQKDAPGIDMPQLIAQQILDEAFKPSDRNGDYRLNFTKMKAIIAGHWRGGSPARSHDYHPEYVEAVEKNVRLEEKLAARSVEARELAELVLRLQSQQKKWLTPGGVNAMKPAFKLAEMLQSECDRAAPPSVPAGPEEGEEG